MSSRLEVGALLLMPVLGCSAIVKELDVSCSQEGACDALNAAEHLGKDACWVYQCVDPRKGCQKLPRDDDGDTFPDPVTCRMAAVSRQLDCDDDAANRFPGALELCDGHDNNCNGVIDEGVLEGHLTPFDSTAISNTDSLSVSTGGADELLIAVTGSAPDNAEPVARTVLYSFSQDGLASTLLQEDSRSVLNCFRGGHDAHCTLGEVVIAATPDLFVALGINVLGCASGQARLASSSLMASLAGLNWNGDGSEDPNLRQGVTTDPLCPVAPAGVRAGALAILPGAAKGTGHALALWRSSQGVGRGGVQGLAMRIEAGPGAEPRLLALPDRKAALLNTTTSGLDAVSIRGWRNGFFLAYDVVEGLELSFLSDLEQGISAAFDVAPRLPISARGARSPALALAMDTNSVQPEGLALAWRAPANGGDAIYFAPVSLASQAPLTFRRIASPLLVASGSEIHEGPALAYAPTGFADQQSGREPGGWLILWIEQVGRRQQLRAARVQPQESQTLEDPFTLAEDTTLKLPFAYETGASKLGFGFVNGEKQQQLNIGSLKCQE